MYRSHSPGESNSVAVVPSPLSSFSPPGYHSRSPPSALDNEFGCDLPAKKPRLCYAQVPAFPFGDYIQERGFDIAALQSTDVTGYSSQTPSPASASPPQAYSAVVQTATTGYQLSSFEESEVCLPAFLQDSLSSGAMQPLHPGQVRSLAAAGQTSFDLPSSGARKEDYKLVIHQQPEEYYRARYETEGIRGPLKGRESNHPAVRILGPATYSGVVKVMLVHDDGSKHTSCFLDETKDRQKALTKKIDPQSNMVVEFEDLRIRRETKSKNYSKEGGRKADKAKGARNDKTACLLFTATLQLSPDKEIELRVLSKPIQLCAPPEGAELEWLIPEYGHTNGDEKIVIKGTKMTCPKVTFTIILPDGHMELPGHVDKEQSHQNVLVVKTPRIPEEVRNYQGSSMCFKAEVRVSSGRAGTCSAPLPFYYIPNGVCHTCKQTLPPAPLSVPVQQTPSFMSTYFPQLSHPGPTISGVTFAGCSTPSPQQGANNPLPSFNEIQPQMSYATRHCTEQLVSTPVGLSHPPSVSTPSPNPMPSSSSHKDSFQQLFETAAANNTQPSPPTLSPSSSPGPVNTNVSYWNMTPTLSSAPVSIQSSQDISAILPGDFPTVTTNTSMQLVMSPASDTVYSAVPSPDTTTSIYPPYSYMDNSNAHYTQFTS